MIQMGKKAGMQSLDEAIMDLLNKKWISPEEAYDKKPRRMSWPEQRSRKASSTRQNGNTGMTPRCPP